MSMAKLPDFLRSTTPAEPPTGTISSPLAVALARLNRLLDSPVRQVTAVRAKAPGHKDSPADRCANDVSEAVRGHSRSEGARYSGRAFAIRLLAGLLAVVMPFVGSAIGVSALFFLLLQDSRGEGVSEGDTCGTWLVPLGVVAMAGGFFAGVLVSLVIVVAANRRIRSLWTEKEVPYARS